MSFRQLVPVAVIAVSLVACRPDSTEPLPPDVLTGQWGGELTILTADRRAVEFQFGCRFVRFPQVLISGHEGRVYLPPTPVIRHAELAMIEGTAVADTLELDVRIGGPYGASLNHVRLVKGQPADFANLLCVMM